MDAIQRLLTVARAYMAHENLAPVTLSWRVFGDTKKLAALESGADIQTGRHAKAMQWFSDNWPAELPWPEGITRPEPAQRQAAAS